jgi:hypothetical protein
MSELLELAIEGHGGWVRWQEITEIRAHIAVGGAVWPLKGWPGALADIHVAADPHRQHVEYSPFLKAGQQGVYEPARTSIVSGGKTIERRESPRQSFAGHGLATQWDPHHLISFAGYAMWTYLTTPFLFRLPGVAAEEVEPWNEDGETWRRLRVIFPASVHSHSTEQTFYFDDFGLLRRHDYSVEIMGGTSSANYASGHKSFGGLLFPTKRRVYAKGPDNRPLLDRLAVGIDFLDIDVR